MPTPSHSFDVTDETPAVLVSAVKAWLPELSWSKVRRLLSARRVMVGNSLCLDESRKLSPGETVHLFDQSLEKPPTAKDVKLYYVDRDIVVVEKPARMVTLRHKKERAWKASKKALQPALEEVIPDLIYRVDRIHRPALLSVHRIDRDTSGLLVFARHADVQKALIEQFASHDVLRKYAAIVAGRPAKQAVRCRLVRNRGDGLRGSTAHPTEGKVSTTHIQPLQSHQTPHGTYTEIECQLETGRTHQIRIHLAEMGHPVCGDTVYRGPIGGTPTADQSQAPRLALHATSLGFKHPGSGEALQFDSLWPADMRRFIDRLGGTKQR